MMLGVRGPVVTSLAACASGVYSFVQALRMIQHGEAEVVITGAAEAATCALSIAGFANARALSTRNDDPAGASRPFDRGRDGFVMSEGGVAMVLESVEHARRRGAKVYAAVAGGAMTADAHHITEPAPDGSGAALAMQRAMADAGLAPEEIDYICAHATATPVGDVAEVNAIKRAFGPAAERVVLSAPKSMLGHLVGSAGAVAGLATILSIKHGCITPTINLTDPDPECVVGCQPTTALERPVRAALINGFGFGGQNATVAFTAWDE
jgi:3-oxoacyl-[acyl-carrier-protein] synthase II